MGTDLNALKAVIKLFADAVVDTESLIKGGVSPLNALLAYKNIVPDVTALVPVVGEIPTEAKALDANDYVDLIATLVADLGITDAHAGSIADAAISLLRSVVDHVVPEIEKLMGLVKKPAAA